MTFVHGSCVCDRWVDDSGFSIYLFIFLFERSGRKSNLFLRAGGVRVWAGWTLCGCFLEAVLADVVSCLGLGVRYAFEGEPRVLFWLIFSRMICCVHLQG